jgi:hypothetical protein
MDPGSWIPDPRIVGSVLGHGGTPDTPRAQGPHGPRSFLDGLGGFKALGAGCHRPGPATQWALGSKHKMYIWHVCIYLYLGEP